MRAELSDLRNKRYEIKTEPSSTLDMDSWVMNGRRWRQRKNVIPYQIRSGKNTVRLPRREEIKMNKNKMSNGIEASRVIQCTKARNLQVEDDVK